jgi:hypothetical protein
MATAVMDGPTHRLVPSRYPPISAFESLRASGGAGILYDSVRHVGGTNAVALQPKNVRDAVMGTHYEITAPGSGKVIARTLT